MRRWRKIALWMLAPVALFAAYRFIGVYKFREGECHPRPPAAFHSTYPKRVVVMTYNIEGHAALLRSDHIARIAAAIEQVRPEIVGLNEVHRATWQSRFGDHVEELRRRTGLNGVFGPSYVFMGGAFGNAVLTRGTILRSEVHPLPGTGEPRSVLETVIRLDGGVVEMYVAHTAAWGGINSAIRDRQLQCLSRHVQTSAYPFIVSGDLNAPPSSREIQHLRSTSVLQMCGNRLPPTQRVMDEQLDYVFADRGWSVRSARVLDIGPSDHRPVVVELIHQ